MTQQRRGIRRYSLDELFYELHRRIAAGQISAQERHLVLEQAPTLLQMATPMEVQMHFRRDMQELSNGTVKRTLEIAVAGGHSLLLLGSGEPAKQALEALPSVLSTDPTTLSMRTVHAHMEWTQIVREMLLAHGGALFLEEFSLFDERERELIQEIHRTRQLVLGDLILPADALLVATMKPCPCGGSVERPPECTCTDEERTHYIERLRKHVDACFDLCVPVPAIAYPPNPFFPVEDSRTIRQNVEAARVIQRRRYAQTRPERVNADLHTLEEAERVCSLDFGGRHLVDTARKQLHFTPLQEIRVLRIARTIADLEAEETVSARRLAEVLQYLSRFGR